MDPDTGEPTGVEYTVKDTPLLINIKGCGYPPEVNCDTYAEKYFNHSMVTTFLLTSVYENYPLSGQDNLPLSLLRYEPVDCHFLVWQVRDSDSNPVRHPHTKLHVCPLPGGSGLLVLPLLSGQVQEIWTADWYQRSSIRVSGYIYTIYSYSVYNLCYCFYKSTLQSITCSPQPKSGPGRRYWKIKK